ncbi:MAG: hypothetical protein HY898_28935 [Deltaproteobacteria bacterium]|nr:hypothetical protein [Deltaproteobacteria bacterium]
MRFFVAFACILCLAGCRAPASSSSQPPPGPSPAAAGDANAGRDAPGATLAEDATTDAGSGGQPPAVERACTRDEDCAVARIGVSGEHVCCASCVFTPGTRRWHAALQRFCGPRPPGPCYPLACPEGPTRAVCRAGLCEATADGVDGGYVRVGVERRCMPSMICDAWTGCALVVGNDQDGWFVEESARATRGDIVSIGNVCTSGGKPCEAARVHPASITCPPHSVPPLISPPSFTCGMDAGECR